MSLSKAAGVALSQSQSSQLVVAAERLIRSTARNDAAAWGRVLAEGKGSVGFMTVAHPDLLDGVQVFGHLWRLTGCFGRLRISCFW
jgi:hypothetical protein